MKHVPASGKIAREAAIYPFQLCKAILEGLRKEMIERGRMLSNLNVWAPALLCEGTMEASQINIASDSGAITRQGEGTGVMPIPRAAPNADTGRS